MVAQRYRVFDLLFSALLLIKIINGSNYMFTIGAYNEPNPTSDTCTKTCNAMSASCVAFKIDNDNPLDDDTVTTTLLQEVLFRMLKCKCYDEGSPESTAAKTSMEYSPYVTRTNGQNCYGWNANAIQTSCTAQTVVFGLRLCLCRKEESFLSDSGCPSGFQRFENQCLAHFPVKLIVGIFQTTFCYPYDLQLLSFNDPKGYDLVVRAGRKYFSNEHIWGGARIIDGKLTNFFTVQHADNASYYGTYNGIPSNQFAVLDTSAGDLGYTNGGNYSGICARYPFVIFSKSASTARLERGHRLLRTPVAILKGYTLNQCFATCMGKMKIGCLSFNMHATNGVCELMAESAENWKSVLVDDDDWYHFSIGYQAFPLN